MSWRPITELQVGLIGSSRGLRFAGRTLAALGAEAVRVAPPGIDPPPVADPHQGGESPREVRLAAWLDEGVTVVPAASARDAVALARGRLAGCRVLLCEPDMARAAGEIGPVVSIGLGLDRERPACGLTAAARGGVAIAIGAPDREPLGLPFDLADYATGLVGAVGALHLASSAAARAEVDAVSVLGAFAGVNGLVYGPYGIPWLRERRRASQCGGPYPYGFWRAKDGWVCAIGRSRADWERLLDALGRPAWSSDQRFGNLRRNGSEHAAELDALIEAWSSTRTRAELLAIAAAHGLALAPVRTAPEVLSDPELLDCGFLRKREDAPVSGPPTVQATRPPRPDSSRPSSAAPRRECRDAGLAGARVLDFGWVWSAPLVGAGLADLGADVVKVEHPERPDNSRLRGRPRPGWNERDDAESLESVPYFLNLNHGKRSIALDLKDGEGADLARRLLGRADVVVENLGEPVFRRLGLHYDDVADENPGLIWLSMATRRCGSEMRGYAPTISSYSGLESAIGYPGDLTGMMTFGLCDPVAGTWGLLSVLAALRERERTGHGCLLQLGQLEGFLALLGEQLEQADREGDTPPAGNVHPYFFPYGVYPAADGSHVAVAALDDGQRGALARLLGVEWNDRDAMERSLRTFVADRPAGEVAAALAPRVACEPVLTYAEAREDAALRDSGLLAPVDHPLVGRHLVYAQPWRVDGARPPVRRPAPVLGADTAEVVAEWLA